MMGEATCVSTCSLYIVSIVYDQCSPVMYTCIKYTPLPKSRVEGGIKIKG